MLSPTERAWRTLAVVGLVVLALATVAGVAAVWRQPERDVARATRVAERRSTRAELPALPPAPDSAASAAGTSTAGAARSATPSCERCHGELELLRQHVTEFDSARALLVPARTVRASAHASMECAECHSGFRAFPHTAGTTTASCASCHAPQDSAWLGSAHARPPGVEVAATGVDAALVDAASCAACHTVHAVESVATLEQPVGVSAMNARCSACHAEAPMPAHDPHADRVACAACHGAHATQPTDVAGSWLSAAREPATCGACHTDALEHWQRDVHGDTARAVVGADVAADDGGLPVCTACHGGHGMRSPTDTTFALGMVQACGACHEHALQTFYDSYHGQAAELGSAVAATCSDCHGTHDVFPTDDARSLVSEARLIETCGQCHAHARAGFVAYDSHPDPLDPGRNLWLSLAFWFMNGLLVFVLVVFGAHTLLWWVKILRDRRRSGAHGSGHGSAAEEA